MATVWPRTAGDLIKSALVELGAISAGDEPENSEYDEAVVRLNGYLQELENEGLMFRESSGTLTIPAGAGLVALPSDISTVSSVRTVGLQHQRPLAEWNRAEYYSIPNRAQTGQVPFAYHIHSTTSGQELAVWPVPTAEFQLHVDYQRPVGVIEGPDETLDIPQKWYNCVMLNVASRCASMFGADRINPSTVARIDARAAQQQQRLLDADRPNSYIFEPYYARN